MISTPDSTQTRHKIPSSRVEVLRAELESTLDGFLTLLEENPERDWRKKSPSTDWTVGQVFVHLTWALEYLPAEVESGRRGKGMFNLPRAVSDTLSFWYIRWLSRTATPDSIRRRYESAMYKAIHLLERIPEEDWAQGADFYGEGFHSVEDLFHVPAQHLAEHSHGMAKGWQR